MRFLHGRGRGRGVGAGRLVVDHGGSLVGVDCARALADPFGGVGEQALPVGQDSLSHGQLVFVRCASEGCLGHGDELTPDDGDERSREPSGQMGQANRPAPEESA